MEKKLLGYGKVGGYVIGEYSNKVSYDRVDPDRLKRCNAALMSFRRPEDTTGSNTKMNFHHSKISACETPGKRRVYFNNESDSVGAFKISCGVPGWAH
jgi:hypothetical protein